MSRAVYEERQAKKLKDLLNWAKSFIFKNQELANEYETTESITLSNYYIACRNDTLPYIYKYDKKGFPEDLNEYNLMPNGQEFYIKAYELNTAYVENDSNRFKEVRSSVHNKNIQMVDPPYMGNVFEVNPYYRGLYCTYGLDIVSTRAAKDYSLIFYDETYITSNINAETFLDLYTKNREWFTQVMENKAMGYDDMHRKFNCMFITLMTIFAYMDTDMQKQFSYDLFDQYDIRNALYSFGITFLNDLPSSFQLRVLKNIRKLIKAKGTDQIYKIIAEDIFGNNITQIYKYYLYRNLGMSNEEIEEFNSGKMSYDKYNQLMQKSSLYFIKIPYNEYDIYDYINRTPEEELQSFPFDDIAGNDTYWDMQYKAPIVNAILGNRSWIESKYIDINTEINTVPDVQGLVLFFSMLHDTIYSFPIKSNTLKDPSLDLFGLFACALYLTKMNIDTSLSDVIPPNSISASTVLATYINNLDLDIYKSNSNNKYKSLTTDYYNKMNINYWQPKDYQYDTSLKSDLGKDQLYYGFAQHFKDNLEILKGLNNALRAVAYDDDDISNIDINLTEGKDYLLIEEDLATRINTYFKNKSLIDKNNHEDSYAEIIYQLLKSKGLDNIHSLKNTPWLKTIIERALITWNEESLFEYRQEFSNKYGYYDIMSIESFLAAKHPIAYAKLADAILGDKKTRIELLMNLFDDITYTLVDVTTYTPPPNGMKSSLTNDVNFKAFIQEYVINYAVKLLDYLKSYTVQLHNSGSVYDLTNKGQATIQLNDLFTGDLHRKKIISEYIFTGKYPWHHDPSTAISLPYYDTDRKGDKYAWTSHERLLDEVQITIRNKSANQKTIDKKDLDEINIDSLRGCKPKIYVPEYTDKKIGTNLANYGGEQYDNSLNFKEALFCRVVTPTSNIISDYLIYKTNTLITSINSPVLVSSSDNHTYFKNTADNYYLVTPQSDNPETSEVSIVTPDDKNYISVDVKPNENIFLVTPDDYLLLDPDDNELVLYP